MELGEEFGEKGRVLGGEGDNAQPPTGFWLADLSPGNFALPPSAVILTGPQKRPAPFVDGFNNPSREDTGAHSVSEEGG